MDIVDIHVEKFVQIQLELYSLVLCFSSKYAGPCSRLFFHTNHVHVPVNNNDSAQCIVKNNCLIYIFPNIFSGRFG